MATPPSLPEDLKPEILVVEASASRERACAECGRRTAGWKPVRQRGVFVLMCAECAAKEPARDAAPCPSCGAVLGPSDRFCGKCGSRIEYGCPACEALVEPEDAFCGKCGVPIG